MASERYLAPAEKLTHAYFAACVRVNLEQFRNMEQFRNIRNMEQRRFSAA